MKVHGTDSVVKEKDLTLFVFFEVIPQVWICAGGGQQ